MPWTAAQRLPLELGVRCAHNFPDSTAAFSLGWLRPLAGYSLFKSKVASLPIGFVLAASRGLTPLSLGRIGPQCVTATRHARLIARTLRHKVGEVAARPDVKAEYSTPSHANQTNSPSHGCVIQPKTLPPVPS